jgi:hypothetical protein
MSLSLNQAPTRILILCGATAFPSKQILLQRFAPSLC